MKKYSQIDFFRGLAALLVFLSHYFAWVNLDNLIYKGVQSFYNTSLKILQTPGEGHPGVICFIVLSGFCIHLPYRGKGLEQIEISKEIKKFFIRRFLRIYPLFIIATILGVFVVYYASTTPLSQTIASYSGSQVQDISLKNIALKLSCLTEFKIQNFMESFLGNAPLASVITEVWLYVAYPFFFYFLRKRGWGFVLTATLLMYILIPVVYLILGKEFGYNWWLFSLFNYYIFWAWGAFLCEVTFGNYKLEKHKLQRILIASGLLYLLCYFLIHTFHIESLKFARMLLLAGLFGATLSLFITTDQRPPLSIKQILSPIYNLISKLGDYSYSLYAIHAPLIFLGIILTSQYSLPSFILLLYPIIVLSLSLITYKTIELPTHKLAKKITK